MWELRLTELRYYVTYASRILFVYFHQDNVPVTNVQKKLTGILKKKAKAQVHLNFYKELEQQNLQPPPEICESNLRYWLGNREKVNEKWKRFNETPNINATEFFTNELEELIASFEQQSKHLEEKLASQFDDETSFREAMKTVNMKVEIDTYGAQDTKDNLFQNPRKHQTHEEPVVSKISFDSLFKEKNEKEVVKEKLGNIMENLAKAEIRVGLFKELKKENLHQTWKTYRRDLYFYLDNRKHIYERWDDVRRNPNKDIRTFFIEELEDLITDLRQSCDKCEEEYKTFFTKNSDFVKEVAEIQASANDRAYEVQKYKDSVLAKIKGTSSAIENILSSEDEVCIDGFCTLGMYV